MHEIECTDETFDPNFTIEYKLSIQVGLDGFSFCILDDIRKKHLVFKHIPYSLSNYSFLYRKILEIIKNDEILQKKYKRVLISFITPKVSFTPVLFEKINQETINNLNFEKTDDETITSFNATIFDGSVIFALPKKIRDYFETKYPNCSITHQLKPLIKIAAQKIKTKQTQSFILINKKFFSLLITKAENLIFFNSFNYINNMDFIYFLLNVYTSLDLNTHDSVINLTGEIKEDSHLIEFMKKHFQKVEYLKLAKDYQYSYTFSKLPQHMFVSVINPEG